jgi:alpha-beta hydrolase superfamily lysophospholipase
MRRDRHEKDAQNVCDTPKSASTHTAPFGPAKREPLIYDLRPPGRAKYRRITRETKHVSARIFRMLAHVLLAALALQGPEPGAYVFKDRTIYVGSEGEPPDHPTVEYYDTLTRRVGVLQPYGSHRYRSAQAPVTVFTLDRPTVRLREQQFVVGKGADQLGASLWTSDDKRPRPTIVLIHGADNETRKMGFLIPYFVSQGLNVLTYDQRGTGASVGNWQRSGPVSKADDVVRLLAEAEMNPAVDRQRLGVWGASNGGWVAPLVATKFPLAFMILKSAPSETIVSNVLFEVRQSLIQHRNFNETDVEQALTFETLMLKTLSTNSGWEEAAAALAAARSKTWFPYMRIPPDVTAPPPPEMLAALRSALVYDPALVLLQVRTPTLALFGALDRNVDARDSATEFRAAFSAAGMKDLTIITFPGASHLLEASASGYSDDPLMPERMVSGYPESMIFWLRKRGLAIRGSARP